VLLTHRNLVSNAQAVNQSGLAGAEDNFLVVLPLHHTFPFTVAFLVPLCLGARITFLQSLKAPDLLQCLREAQVTVLVGVPQLFAMVRRAIFNEIDRRPAMVRMVVRLLLSVCGLVRQHTGLNMGKGLFAQVHRRFGASLRLLCSGGARLDPAVARDLFRLGFTLLEGYGLTETAPVVTFNPLARPKFGSVGLPIPGVEVRIVHPGAEGIGEVVVRGPNVMKGYDGNPDATGQAIREGWFYTGDLGYLDREGYLVLTGRIKELIVTPGGKNIYPEEVEAQYLASPAIAELCLVGTERTEEGGEGLHAVVVPNFAYLQAQQISDVRGHLKQELTRIGLSLPPYKRVTGLSVVKESLPRTRLGKIQRYRVAAQLAIEEPPPGEQPWLSAADREALETEVGRRVVAALRPLASKRAPIVPDDHLDLDLGLDSLRRVELAVALEQWVGPLPETGGHLEPVRGRRSCNSSHRRR
jgi:long-chain acyl-CoA synthetase